MIKKLFCTLLLAGCFVYAAPVMPAYAQRPADEQTANQPAQAPSTDTGVQTDASSKPIDPCEGISGSPICTDLRRTSDPVNGKSGLLYKVSQGFVLVTGVVSVFMIVIGGLRYVLSAGDSGKTSSAKNTILYAAVGLVVALSGGVIVEFILSRL